MFGGLLDATIWSVHACGEDVKISVSFTYSGSVVHNKGESGPRGDLPRGTPGVGIVGWVRRHAPVAYDPTD